MSLINFCNQINQKKGMRRTIKGLRKGKYAEKCIGEMVRSVLEALE